MITFSLKVFSFLIFCVATEHIVKLSVWLIKDLSSDYLKVHDALFA